MTAEVLSFLLGNPHGLAIFEAIEDAIHSLGESTMQVSKTQISWGNPKKFAFFSLPQRAGAGFPKECVVLSFGLDHRIKHPRIVHAANPYPNRWTHHTALTEPKEVDKEVLSWLAEAFQFSMTKAPRNRR